MPFDSTPAKTVTHPSVEGLIAWLETQPGETEYQSYLPQSCLLAQYVTATLPNVSDISADFVVSKGERRWYDPELIGIALRGPSRFGDALSRARSLVEQG